MMPVNIVTKINFQGHPASGEIKCRTDLRARLRDACASIPQTNKETNILKFAVLSGSRIQLKCRTLPRFSP